MSIRFDAGEEWLRRKHASWPREADERLERCKVCYHFKRRQVTKLVACWHTARHVGEVYGLHILEMSGTGLAVHNAAFVLQRIPRIRTLLVEHQVERMIGVRARLISKKGKWDNGRRMSGTELLKIVQRLLEAYGNSQD